MQDATKYKQKFRILSTRLKYYNYQSNGAYFITICTGRRTCCLGKIIDEKMNPSEVGKIAGDYWHEIPNNFRFVELNEWVIMPNHIHGIIIFDSSGYKNNISQKILGYREIKENKINNVAKGGITNIYNPMLHNNLSTIIRWYKGRTTFEIRKKYSNFSWQPRFYEHVIRSEHELMRISEYIINNPLSWHLDDYYVE